MFWVVGEMRMCYDPLSLIVGDFMSASLLVKSVLPELAPGHRNTISYTGKLSARLLAFASWGFPRHSLGIREIQGPFPKALFIPVSSIVQEFIIYGCGQDWHRALGNH